MEGGFGNRAEMSGLQHPNISNLSGILELARNGTRSDIHSMLRQKLMAMQIAEQKEKIANVGVKYHIILGLLILIANSFLIGFYIKFAKIRRYISITMLAVFISSFLQVRCQVVVHQ